LPIQQLTLPLLVSQAVRQLRRALRLILLLTLPFYACDQNSGGPVFFGNVKEVSVGDAHTAAIDKDGKLYVWGNNTYGQLGDAGTTTSLIPVQIRADKNWIAVSAGYAHTTAIDKDGKLWAWGYNVYGQLGDGSTTNGNVPIQIRADKDWIAVSAGFSHTVAIDKNGKLWAWGRNLESQLGDGGISGTNSNVPVQIGTKDWIAVSAGRYHTTAIDKDGKLWAWGSSNCGQLGDNTTAIRSAPVQVGTLAQQALPNWKWIAVSAGELHTAAIAEDGKLWAWGYNGEGQLGDGTSDTKYAPVQIRTDKDWIAVSAGGSHTAAIDKDNKLWIWGNNESSQLGINTIKSGNAPVQLGGDRWIAVSASRYAHTAAIKNDWSLWSWGNNNYGQLGDSTKKAKSTPVKVILSLE